MEHELNLSTNAMSIDHSLGCSCQSSSFRLPELRSLPCTKDSKSSRSWAAFGMTGCLWNTKADSVKIENKVLI